MSNDRDNNKKNLRVGRGAKGDSFGPLFVTADEIPLDPIETFAHHEASLPEIGEYLIKGLIDKGAVGVLYGLSGSCKSFLAIDLSEHIALGCTWNGRRGKQGFGVYIAAEGGQRIKVRIVASRKAHGFQGMEVPVEFVTRAFNLLDADEVQALCAVLRSIAERRGREIDFIIFDTLSQCIPGADENSNGTFMLVVRVAHALRDQFGATVLFIHHRGKEPGKGPRGGSALYAACDFVLLAERKGERVDKTIEGELLLEKVRDYESGQVYVFEARFIDIGLDAEGDPITSRVVQYVGEATRAVDARKREHPAHKPTEAEALALKVLQETLEQANAASVEIDAWRKGALPKLELPADENERTKYERWKRALNGLVKKRFVRSEGKRASLSGWEGVRALDLDQCLVTREEQEGE